MFFQKIHIYSDKLKKSIMCKEARLYYLNKIFPWILEDDQKFLECVYYIAFGKKLSIECPQTFNEKLQWLKLYDRRPEYTMMVDKYHVKKYVAEKIGKEHIIPTLGVWDKFDEIDFDLLPNQFVLKCIHDSGGLVIVNDKNQIDKKVVKKKIEMALKRDYFYVGREWPYKNVKPQIIAEKYLSDKGNGLNDYKFFCFNGEVKFFKIDFDRFVKHRANYYDLEMNLLPFGEADVPPDESKHFDKPVNFDKMVFLASILAEGIPFVRVDFYNLNGAIYFGELTLYPASGFGRFVPEEWDEILGSWIKLSDSSDRG